MLRFLINNATLKFLDNMSAVEKSKTMTFDILITKVFGIGGVFQDRFKYTHEGMYAEHAYTNIDDPFPDAIVPWTQCEDI